MKAIKLLSIISVFLFPSISYSKDLNKIVKDIKFGKTYKYDGKRHQPSYRRGSIKNCAFTLDVRTMITTPNCGKTKTVKSFVQGRPDYKMPDCTVYKPQHYSILVDLTSDEVSGEAERSSEKYMRNMYKIKIGGNNFYFYIKKVAERTLRGLQEYQKKHCLKSK